MSQVFRLPDLGEGLTEAEIIGWRVAVGDTVAIDQIVVEVETAKAAVEVPSPYAGVVHTLHAEPGAVLPVGEPMITVRRNGSDDAAGAGAAPADTERTEAKGGSGNVLVGYGTDDAATTRRRRRVAPAPVAAQPVATVPAPVLAPATGRSDAAPLVISPLVRRLAQENGLDLSQVASSGPGGIVLRRDVEQALSALARPQATAGADVIRIPLRGVRGAVAQKLTTSRQEIPEVTIWVDADATGLLEARQQLKQAGVPVSLLALLARITVLGLRRFPQLNSQVDLASQEVVQHSAVHLGLAAQTDRGLVVPVVRDAHTLALPELSQAIDDVIGRARDGKASTADLTGGTVTLNNYGVFGVDGSTPIINHPQAAIVGVGRIVDKPWAVDGRLEVRKVTQLVLAFDHRVCDGGVAGGYLRFVADCVESPLRMLAEG